MMVACVNQMAPSPILMYIGEEFGIAGNDALMNLAISIIYPTLILGCLLGGIIEKKIGTKALMTITGLAATAGLLINFVSVNYTVFLIGRALFGFGFGIGIPFMGSAIMKWYVGRSRELMTTVNSLFPFIGTVTCYLIIAPQYHMFFDNVKTTFGVWGIVLGILTLIWIIFIKAPTTDDSPSDIETNDSESDSSVGFSIYLDLLKNKSIRLLSITFICDFACYSYMATILPTYLMEVGHMEEASATLWSAIAFPAAGIVGCAIAGIVNTSLGQKKFTLVSGQILKLIGIIIMTLLGSSNPILLIVGTVLFGFGNSFWMPSFYGIPTELPGMDASRVAASFSLSSSCGFVMGFIVPVAGGLLTGLFVDHGTGLTMSLLIFNILNLFALFEAIRVPAKHS